jgi:hypothetical protein
MRDKVLNVDIIFLVVSKLVNFIRSRGWIVDSLQFSRLVLRCAVLQVEYTLSEIRKSENLQNPKLFARRHAYNALEM